MLDGKKRLEAMSTSPFKYSREVFVHVPSGVSTGMFSLQVYTYEKRETVKQGRTETTSKRKEGETIFSRILQTMVRWLKQYSERI